MKTMAYLMIFPNNFLFLLIKMVENIYLQFFIYFNCFIEIQKYYIYAGFVLNFFQVITKFFF